jgi:DNA-binding NarL/FixJ family response regulator
MSSSAKKVPRPDLERIARAVTRAMGGKLDAELVRSRWGGPAYVGARHKIILRATAAGYRAVEIAAYLRISSKTVSTVLATERRRLLRSRT